jgi:hypothetical protein
MSGSLQLSEYAGDMVRLSCEKCGRSGQYRKQKLIERYGADIRLPDLRQEIAQCRRHGQMREHAHCSADIAHHAAPHEWTPPGHALLCKRGFLKTTAWGTYRMTLTGWVVILLRKTSARSKPADKRSPTDRAAI